MTERTDDRAGWRDPALELDFAAEAALVEPPPGAEDRVFAGLMASIAAGAAIGAAGAAHAATSATASSAAGAATASAASSAGLTAATTGTVATTGAVATAVGGAAATGGLASALGGAWLKGIVLTALLGGGAAVVGTVVSEPTPEAPAIEAPEALTATRTSRPAPRPSITTSDRAAPAAPIETLREAPSGERPTPSSAPSADPVAAAIAPETEPATPSPSTHPAADAAPSLRASNTEPSPPAVRPAAPAAIAPRAANVAPAHAVEPAPAPGITTTSDRRTPAATPETALAAAATDRPEAPSPSPGITTTSDRRAPAAAPEATVAAATPGAVPPAAPVETAEPVDIAMPDPALKAESLMLEAARQRLDAGDPRGALARLAGHRARFPDGRLTEERDVLEIRALIGAGRIDEARQRARAFVERHPDSPYRRSLQPVLDAERP